jgi:hypothetical protein
LPTSNSNDFSSMKEPKITDTVAEPRDLDVKRASLLLQQLQADKSVLQIRPSAPGRPSSPKNQSRILPAVATFQTTTTRKHSLRHRRVTSRDDIECSREDRRHSERNRVHPNGCCNEAVLQLNRPEGLSRKHTPTTYETSTPRHTDKR